MHKYIVLFFSVLVFLTACGGDNAPEGIIEQPQMVGLLTEIHLTDGGLYNVPQVPDSLYKYGSARYVAVFKRYHTTDKQFATSLKYYTTQPLKLTEIYEKVSQNIKGKTDSLVKKSTPKSTLKNKDALPAQ
ncbi:DUF4296 domain-containing protein [Mucilaginibacter gilvus]|uniref:DUF4296 domain-containing protein n=1 Tax=Mucilaginibacter gilvus TaxID=2305909 RepID=A0A3S3UXB4_9SPHI|nr:DUF4296 domain-containing protein [Mucilaginibacter gilvus]RWY50374.1 DUF4296 domain-containing protein [Mucilaginibacter gilvus]